VAEAVVEGAAERAEAAQPVAEAVAAKKNHLPLPAVEEEAAPW
jgi:hypothetical protein